MVPSASGLSPAPARRFFRFSYPTWIRDGDPLLPFRTRDGAAFSELTEPLRPLGWQYGSLIFNYPDDCDHPRADFTFLRPSDLVVLATRPPMNDKPDDKKRLTRSSTYLEQLIFKAIRPYIRSCSRNQVTLNAVGLDCEKADYSFRQYTDARLLEYRSLAPGAKFQKVEGDKYVTIGFFLNLPAIEDFGCGLLASFSMGGIETLIWNRIVRTRYSAWLAKPLFAVYELEIGTLPTQPITLDFVDAIGAMPLLEIDL